MDLPTKRTLSGSMNADRLE